MYMLNMVIILIVMYSNVVTAIDKIPTYLLRFNTTCPSFEDPKWEFLRQNMVDAHQGDPALMMDEAAQRMKEAWARENQRKVNA